MNVLYIMSALTPINEFGQDPSHADFNVWLNFFMLFLWPLLIFISYKFISYTMNKLEKTGFLDEPEEGAEAPSENSVEKTAEVDAKEADATA